MQGRRPVSGVFFGTAILPAAIDRPHPVADEGGAAGRNADTGVWFWFALSFRLGEFSNGYALDCLSPGEAR